MGFVVFFFISWLTILIFAILNKKLSVIEGTFVFLVILIVNINFSWIIIDELQLTSLTKKGLPYTGHLLNRSIVIPTITLIYVNLIYLYKTFLERFVLFISFILLLMFISRLLVTFEILEFKNWRFWYDSIYYSILLLIGILCYKGMNKVSRNVVKN